MITFQRTRHSIVVICRRCGARDVFAGDAGAQAWAVDHIGREERIERDRQTRLAVAASRARATRRY